MASRASASGRTWREERAIFLMGTRLAVMRVSPCTARPFSRVATRWTFERVEGKMRPRMASTLLLTRMASVKSPVTCVSAARKRLPKLWPARPRPAWKRYWKRRPRRASSFERATMQLRISPGGRMRFSRRKRPELPPSSVTVTMAARSAMGRSMLACSPVWRMTSSLRPRRSVERPVPPPRATTRKPRERVFGLDVRFFTTAFRISGKKKSQEKDFTQRTPRTQRSQRRKKQDRLKPVPTKTRQKQLVPFQLFTPNYKQAGSAKTQAQLFPKELYHQVGTALAGGAIFLRIEQLGEARVFLEEIGRA